MDPIPAWVRRFWDVWDLRMLVLLSLALQMILSLFGNRRKYISSLWISILVWSAYLSADLVATVALGKLSDAQVDFDSGNALRAIWAPLLLLHLGGPDTITAYSLEDNHLWMRHFLALLVQLSVAVYVILMSWKQSWFSTMSIPALVAGFIKYGERTWVLLSVSQDKSKEVVPFGEQSKEVVPFGDQPRGSSLGNNNTSENENSVHVLYIAHTFLKLFTGYMRYYDLKIPFKVDDLVVEDNIQLWNAVEVEMGLMFDLLYTKAAINFSKRGWILRCITFTCTVTVLMGLIVRLITTTEDREKWHKVDIAITAALLVGALALEIYAIISLYLCSDWAMLWLIKHNRGKQGVQFRKKYSVLFLPKQYRCKTMAQFNLFDEKFLKDFKPDQMVGGGILQLLRKKYMLNKYVQKPAVFVRSDHLFKYVQKPAVFVPFDHLFKPVVKCRARLTGDPAVDHVLDHIWRKFFEESLENQIIWLHVVTEVLYKNDVAISQHPTAPSGSSSSWEKDMKLCRTLSHYMMYLLVMRTRLLPVLLLDSWLWDKEKGSKIIEDIKQISKHGQEKMGSNPRQIFEYLKSKQQNEMWKILKYNWVRMLCDAASKVHRNEHLGQLSQGGEFLTFLWFFLPPANLLKVDNQSHAQ